MNNRSKNLQLLCKTSLCTTFLWGICVCSFAQIGHGGTPYSFKKKVVKSFVTVSLPSLDNQLLLQEEAVEKKNEGYPFGKEIAVNYRLDNSGTWENLPDGGRLWRLGIESKGAYSINLLFDNFYIPSSSNLFIYTTDQSFVLGSFTVKNNNQWGNFATTVLPGDAIVLEFYEAAQDRNEAIINLSTVVHGYKNAFFQKGQYGKSGYCNVNINCEVGETYQAVKQAVALILKGGSAYCSGTLVNNTAQDTTPYFITAYHCVYGKDLSTFVFIFNYETVDCGGTNPTTTYSVNGATAIAMCDTSDFALLLLNDRPIGFNAYYAGWNRKDTLYEGAVCIHHPNGDWKKISEDRKMLGSGKFWDEYPSFPDNTHYVVVWDTGTTQGGSSGSGLFNSHGLLIGQLEGGYASCSDLQGEDYFGKFSYSWTNNNSPDNNRLDYWLDPLGAGVEFLEGMGVFKESNSLEVKIVGVDRICVGDSTYLKAIPIKGEFINHQWSWKDTNGIVQTVIGDSLKIYGSGVYMLASEDSSGCFAKDSFVVAYLKLIIDATITDVACYGEATGLWVCNEITDDVGGELQWVKLTGKGVSFIDSLMIPYLFAGIYTIEAENHMGCLLYDEFEIKENDLLKIAGVQQPATSGLDNGTLKLTATGGVPPYKFEIKKGVLASFSDTAWDLSAGIYQIKVMDAVNCVTTDTISVTSISGISKRANNKSSIIIYPNPTTGQLKITNYELRENIVMDVYDVYGKCHVSRVTCNEIMDISHLANGMYFLKVNNNVVKVIKN